MLTKQAAKAFENFDIGPSAEDQPYNDRLILEKLPSGTPYRTVRDIAETIVETAQKAFAIPKDHIFVHGLRCDGSAWRIEIRSEDTLPHYMMQPMVRKIVAEKLAASEAEENSAPSQEETAPPQPVLGP